MSPTFIYIPASGPLPGTQDFKISYLSVGGSSCLAKDQWGDIYVWGLNNYGQLGNGGTSTGQTPTKHTALSAVSIDVVKMGESHCLYTLTTDSKIYGFGRNHLGQLGFDNTTLQYQNPVALFSNGNIEQFGAGFNHSLISSAWGGGSNGLRLFTSGNNSFSSLGRTGNSESFIQITSPVEFDSQLALSHKFSGGSNHSIAIVGANEIYTFGKNNYGQLGLNHTTSPVAEPALVPGTATLFGFSNPKQIECGDDTTFVLTENGKVWACGRGTYGRLGLGDTNSRDQFTQITTVNNGSGNEPIGTISKIGVGHDHLALLSSSGNIYLAGNGGSGQLSTGFNITTLSTPTLNNYQISNPSHVFSDVGCGNDFTIAVDSSSVAWSTGKNSSFELGLGDNSQRSSFTKMSYTLP